MRWCLGPAPMCTVITLRDVVEGFPLILAMNRDEFLDRESGPPRVWDVRPRLVAPVDLRAGGTWFGVNETGVAVVLTNRGKPAKEPRRSRGLFTLDLLRTATADDARMLLVEEGEHPRHNGFNIVVAEKGSLTFGWTNGGGLRLVDGAEGVSILTNDGLNDHREAKVSAVHRFLAECNLEGLEEAFNSLKVALAMHDVPVCRHEDDRGTRSSFLLALAETGIASSHLLFADGPPCTTPFDDASILLEEIVWVPEDDGI